MELILERVTGFESRDNTIKVCGENGRTLYYFQNPLQKRVTFNLPQGNWNTESELRELKRSLKYVCPKLPPPTKKPIVKSLSYEVGNNPNKCSIDTKTGKVLIDKSIAKKDIPFLTFVLFHENGHFFYTGGGEGENFCDIWAGKKMLERGYNPSQIYFAQEFCLSEKSIDRKDYLYNWLKKVKCYE